MTPKPKALALAILHALAIQRGKTSGRIWINSREGLVVN